MSPVIRIVGAASLLLTPLSGCRIDPPNASGYSSESSGGSPSSGSTDPVDSGDSITGTSTSGGVDTVGGSTDGVDSGTQTSDTGPEPCGNGMIDAGEDCDEAGESATCDDDCTLVECGDGITNTTAGEDCDHMGASLTCDDDCTLVECGDLELNTVAGEVCDGTDLGGATCEGEGFDDGTLACTAGCQLNPTGCFTCGDGMVGNGEICDGGDLGGGTCAAQGFDGGTLGCSPACTYDTTGCFSCGDGFINPGEQCDDSGESPGCDADCTFAVCGDGMPNASSGEQCDDGGETASCDVDCTAPACGDALVNAAAGEQCDGSDLGGSSCAALGFDSGTLACQADCLGFDAFGCGTCGNGTIDGAETCDDGNNDETDGCTSACTIPASCNDVLTVAPSSPDGVYQIDPDGSGGNTGIQAFCDMTTAGGGWTVIERSAFGPQAIGSALFNDLPVNPDDPSATPYRLGRPEMNNLQNVSTDMRIDCRGSDYLLTDVSNLFNGEGGANNCDNWTMVTYEEASLKGNLVINGTICTWNRGTSEGCAGAWHIDEHAQQGYCGLPNYPWTGHALTTYSADTFAVDPNTLDGIDPVHDCHQAGASRWIMVR